MEQEELKQNIKAWLKDNGKDYSWLAEVCGVSKNTINNYLAKKPIPASKIPVIESIINGEIDTSCEEFKTPAKRHRRTRAQMREDLEQDIAAAQEVGGYIDQEEDERKVKLLGVESQLDYIEQRYDERESARDMSDYDMSDPDIPECINEGQVYRIVIPNNILKVYKEEAKWSNMHLKNPLKKVTVAMLISKAIYDTAETIIKYEEEEKRQLSIAPKLMEERAQLKRDYNFLKQINN